MRVQAFSEGYDPESQLIVRLQGADYDLLSAPLGCAAAQPLSISSSRARARERHLQAAVCSMTRRRSDAGKRAPNGHRKLPQITRDSLDGRTRIAHEYDSIVDGISADLGGADRLSVIQRTLIEAYAGVCCVLNDLNARALQGEPFDLLQYATAVSDT